MFRLDNKTLLIVLVTLVLIKPAFAKSEAGFSLNQELPALYHQSGVSAFNQTTIDISKIHGFDLVPKGSVQTGLPGQEIVFNHTLENLGNGTASFRFRVKKAPPNVEVKIRVGTREVIESLIVPERAAVNFVIAVKVPETIKKQTYDLEIEVATTEQDGDAYVGYDGRLHGGKDEIILSNRLKL